MRREVEVGRRGCPSSYKSLSAFLHAAEIRPGGTAAEQEYKIEEK